MFDWIIRRTGKKPAGEPAVADELAGLLRQGNEAEDAGLLEQAEKFYRQAASLDPLRPEVQHLLGRILGKNAKYEESIAILKGVIERFPKDAQAYSTLGNIYRLTGNLQAAINNYNESLLYDYGNALTHYNLAKTLNNVGRIPDAMRHLEIALSINPEFIEAGLDLGALLITSAEFTKAAIHLEKLIDKHPSIPLAHYNYGIVCQHLGDYDVARNAFSTVLRIEPDNINAHIALGACLRHLEKYHQAVSVLEKALAIDNKAAKAWHSLGNVYFETDQLQQAVDCYRQALINGPASADIYTSLGNALREQGKREQAIDEYDRALQQDAMHAEAHYNRAFPLLSLGRLEEGWHEYEWGIKTGDRGVRDLPFPVWKGEPIEGKTILVYAEQGIGDEIRYASCIPELVGKAAHVVIECQPRLAGMFTRSFPGAKVIGSERMEMQWLDALPPVDYQIPMGSLPLYLRKTHAAFPEQNAYLAADPGQISEWQERLNALGSGPKVGISWRSSVMNARRARYILSFDEWRKIMQVPGICFINLQYDECSSELDVIKKEWGVNIHNFENLDQFNDIEGVAALLCALDLTITSASVVSVLAAALGRDVWIPSIAGHHVMLGKEYCPWYRSMSVFAQKHYGDWSGVADGIARSLRLRYS